MIARSEFADHGHVMQSAPPYDHSKPITCPMCVERMAALRETLCDKYGWATWPWAEKVSA